MIFSVHLGHLDEVTDPVRYLCRQLEHDDGPPLLMSASVEEMREYLRRFHSLPANTLWLFAEQGMTQRDFRYGFHKRQLDLWGKGGGLPEPALLRHRVSGSAESAHGRHGRADAVRHGAGWCPGLLPYPGGQGHHPGEDPGSQRMRALVFDMQPSIQKALKSAQFDLVTLDMAAGRIPVPGHLILPGVAT